MSAHKSIRIPFIVGGRNYEAVGFLDEGESPVDGEELLRRTAGENGGAVGEEDDDFLRERFYHLPPELRPYKLVTSRPDPDHQLFISTFFFSFGERRWFQNWELLDDQRHDRYLVVRRCSSS